MKFLTWLAWQWCCCFPMLLTSLQMQRCSATEAYSLKLYSKQTEQIHFCTQFSRGWCENVRMVNKYSPQKTISSLHINTHILGLLNWADLTSISLKRLQLSKTALEKEIISIKSRGHNAQTINWKCWSETFCC